MSSCELTVFMPLVWSVALISARLLPVALMSPIFGGAQSPMHLRLGLVLSLALFLHLPGGIAVTPALHTAELLVGALREVVCGLALGLASSLPLDLARMTGRVIDQFRGSQIDAAVAWGGGRESATGDVLYQYLLALVALSAVMPLVLRALFATFSLVPLGGFALNEAITIQLVALVAATFSAALALGVPVAAASLALDALAGIASRVNGSLNLSEHVAPVRLLAGAAMTCLALVTLGDQLLDAVVSSANHLRELAHANR